MIYRDLLKAIFLITFCYNGSQSICQSAYIGLRIESNVLQSTNTVRSGLWPKFQLIDSVLYVPTSSGVYSKHLNTLSDTTWNIYAFDEIPISDFIKKNNEIVAITDRTNDSLIVYSNDNGLTYNYLSSSHFNDPQLVPPQSNTLIYKMAHNSPGFDTLLVLHHFGISMSTDLGNSWSLLTQYTPEYQYRFIDFNPADNQKIYSTGEGGFFTSYIYASSDGGVTWNKIHSVQNDCVHTIAFHPSNEEVYIIGREGRISKSLDGGSTWSTFNLTPYLYINEIQYDSNNPNILYASGGLNGIYDTIYFLKSFDAGDTWNIIHQELSSFGDVGQVIDFEILNEGIIYLTELGGMYFLDAAVLNNNDIIEEFAEIYISPNPFEGVINVKSSQLIESITLCDNLGRIIERFNKPDYSYSFNLENMNVGIYYLHIQVNDTLVSKKIVKE